MRTKALGLNTAESATSTTPVAALPGELRHVHRQHESAAGERASTSETAPAEVDDFGPAARWTAHSLPPAAFDAARDGSPRESAGRFRSGKCCPSCSRRCRRRSACGFSRSSTAAAMICPTGSSRTAARPRRSRPPAAAGRHRRGRPSMVVTSLPRRSGNRRDARTHRLAIEVDRAGAALRHAAAELGSREAKRLAHHPQERRVGRDVHRAILAVHSQIHHGTNLLGVSSELMGALGSNCRAASRFSPCKRPRLYRVHQKKAKRRQILGLAAFGSPIKH